MSIARVLFRKPDVLLLDEATSNFDEATSRGLYRLIFDRLPKTILISIGRPALLAKLHNRAVDLGVTPRATMTAEIA